ncbi:MAG: methyltransferase domain-containing protein [Gemmatimonadota bacterium]|nr:methyltransferase domain-containing protein [Gemmatimonadota bacterium]
MTGPERDGRRRRSHWEKYEAFASAPAGKLRADALGSDVVNGYTTLDQAERIRVALDLGPEGRLLDVGGGRGWPGTHVAAESGCSLVVTDLPMNALREAATRLVQRAPLPGVAAGPALRGTVVRADGRRLPFPDASFDGVCHADVLC